MDQKTAAAMHACIEGSLAGTMGFPEVVWRLMAVGAESYHADLYRHEETYYMPDGDSHVEAMPRLVAPEFSAASVAAEFSAEGVQRAIVAVQRQEIDYVEFLRRIMAAGTVGYTVHLRGRRAIYVGRSGDFHVEHFPPAN